MKSILAVLLLAIVLIVSSCINPNEVGSADIPINQHWVNTRIAYLHALFDECMNTEAFSRDECTKLVSGALNKPAIEKYRHLAAKHMPEVLQLLAKAQARNAALEQLVRETHEAPEVDSYYKAALLSDDWRERAAKLLEIE